MAIFKETAVNDTVTGDRDIVPIGDDGNSTSDNAEDIVGISKL